MTEMTRNERKYENGILIKYVTKHKFNMIQMIQAARKPVFVVCQQQRCKPIA